MWEKCVGCGEGLFAGDAFCGNCGRPVTPSVPAAREPDGLGSAPLAAPAADRGQVRIIPSAYHPGAPGQAGPSTPGPSTPARNTMRRSRMRQSRMRQYTGRQPSPTPVPEGRRAATRRRWTGRRRTGRARRPAPRRPRVPPGRRAPPGRTARSGAITSGPGVRGGRTALAWPAVRRVATRPAKPRLSGPGSLDPARNPRYLRYVLRQAGVFTGIYLLTEIVLLLCVLLSAAAGTKLAPAFRLEMDSMWLVALVLAIPFWLIPVPALLAEWSQVMEQSSDATQTAFEHINSAFQAHGAPVDSLRARTVSRPGEGEREYLELRRGHFSGYISCFAHGNDLYVGWTFWLHMSPLRLLMMVIGRNIQDVTSRGDGIYRSLRFESTRALVAAMHGAALGRDRRGQQGTRPGRPATWPGDRHRHELQGGLSTDEILHEMRFPGQRDAALLHPVRGADQFGARAPGRGRCRRDQHRRDQHCGDQHRPIQHRSIQHRSSQSSTAEARTAEASTTGTEQAAPGQATAVDVSPGQGPAQAGPAEPPRDPVSPEGPARPGSTPVIPAQVGVADADSADAAPGQPAPAWAAPAWAVPAGAPSAASPAEGFSRPEAQDDPGAEHAVADEPSVEQPSDVEQPTARVATAEQPAARIATASSPRTRLLPTRQLLTRQLLTRQRCQALARLAQGRGPQARPRPAGAHRSTGRTRPGRRRCRPPAARGMAGR